MVRSKAFERKREKCKIPGVIGLFPIPDELIIFVRILKWTNDGNRAF